MNELKWILAGVFVVLATFGVMFYVALPDVKEKIRSGSSGVLVPPTKKIERGIAGPDVRFVDEQYDVVCYTSSAGISCVKLDRMETTP